MDGWWTDRQTEDLDLAMPSIQSCTEGVKGQLRNLCMQVHVHDCWVSHTLNGFSTNELDYTLNDSSWRHKGVSRHSFIFRVNQNPQSQSALKFHQVTDAIISTSMTRSTACLLKEHSSFLFSLYHNCLCPQVWFVITNFIILLPRLW